MESPQSSPPPNQSDTDDSQASSLATQLEQDMDLARMLEVRDSIAKKQQKRAQKMKALAQWPKPKPLVAMMRKRKKRCLLAKTGMAEGRERDKLIGVSDEEAEVDEVEKSIAVAKKTTVG